MGLRETMVFAEAIRNAGDEYISSVMGGKKYVAAHCRRTDFLKARTGTTPGPSAIASQLNEVLMSVGADTVYIATDAPDELRESLKSNVKGSVYFLSDAGKILEPFKHPGKRAAVEMWIAARADFFIG